MWAVLGICGSLRRNSHNAALLRLAGRSNPDVSVVGGDLAGRLPLFNPDLDDDGDLPEVVTRFRSCADRAEGVIIATPEYAHGPSGATKNAMDWLVGSGGLAGKPTLLMSASPGQAGGMRGHLALIPTLTLMGSVLVDSVTVSGAPAGWTPVVSSVIRRCWSGSGWPWTRWPRRSPTPGGNRRRPRSWSNPAPP